MLSLPFIPATAQNNNRPKVIVPFSPRTLDQARAVVDWAGRAREAGADAFEWRVDALVGGAGQHSAESAELLKMAQRAIQGQSELPVLITLRSAAEGGQAQLDEAGYAGVVSEVISCAESAQASKAHPRIAVDIEIDREAADQLRKHAGEAGIPVVASHHDFDRTPSTGVLLAKIRDMIVMGADVAKIAVMPQDPSDVARVLEVCSSAVETAEVPIIAISMGALGRTTRVFGGDFGSAATFAPLDDEPTAPGQISVAKLRSIWTEVR